MFIMLTVHMELAIMELKGIAKHAKFLADSWNRGESYTNYLVKDMHDSLRLACEHIADAFNGTKNDIIAIELDYLGQRIINIYNGVCANDRVTSLGLSYLADASYALCNTINQYAMEVKA